jgi:hypothetical protein
MPQGDLHGALRGITADDVHIDDLGRAVITNADLVTKLASAGAKSRPGLGQAAGNIICTGSMPTAGKEVLQALRSKGEGQ